jgi:hypothetical protein
MMRRVSFAMVVFLGCAYTGPGLQRLADAFTGATGTTGQPLVGGLPLSGYPEAVLVEGFDAENGGKACSGALIAPRVVLTAGHCVDGLVSFQVVAPYAAQQEPVMGVGTTFDYKNKGDIVDPDKHDVGIVVLAAPINLQSYPTVTSTPAPDGTQVTDIGRVQDGVVSTTGLFMGPEVAVSDGASAGFSFDYVTSAVTEDGDSGGPVVQSGTHTIVAVTSGGNGTQDLLARVDLVHDWIIQQIASSGSGMPSPPASPPPPPPSAPPSGIGGCADPGKFTVASVVVGCPEAAPTTSAGCRFIFSAKPPSAMTVVTNRFDVGEEQIDTPGLVVEMSSSATIGSTVQILADKYVADAEGNLPATPKSRNNVVGLVQVDNCPSSTVVPGPPAPPPPRVTCTSSVRSLDLFPDDTDNFGGGWGHPGKLPVSCNVPPAAGSTSLTLSSPSMAVVWFPGLTRQVVSPGVWNWSWPFLLVRSTTPVATQLVMTATPQHGEATTLTVPLHIAANRPPSVVGIGGDFDFSSQAIDFGSILPGRSSNRKLVITNQGPARSRFRGGLNFLSSKPFSLLNAQGSGAQSAFPNTSSCASYIDLQSGESCTVTLQFAAGGEGRTVVVLQVIDYTQNATQPNGSQFSVQAVALVGTGCPRCGGSTCVDLSRDPLNCGTCGGTCYPLGDPLGRPNYPPASCVAGSCTCPSSIPTVCSLNDKDRICENLQISIENCGVCGRHCLDGSCNNGTCSCAAGLQLCAANDGVDRICTDVSSDPANCSRCGNACPSGMSCAGSVCIPSPTPPLPDCRHCRTPQQCCVCNGGAWVAGRCE